MCGGGVDGGTHGTACRADLHDSALVEDATVTTLVQHGAREDPNVRADITFFTTAGGGSVFSAGSIAFSQALPIQNGDNNISVLLRNVVGGMLEGREKAEI
jgi:hypothetical protein